MATDDLSRSAYYPQKRYSGVRMQQGRVLTDDDFNEQEQINHEDKRLSNRDIIGIAGSPNQGFAIDNVVDDAGSIDFDITAGTFYIGGVRVELATTQSFQLQPDWLQISDFAAPATERHDMVYLEVWQQEVSAVEDSELIEKALGGPDTTTRRRTMYRVKISEDVGTNYCPEAWQQVKTSIQADIGGVWECGTQLSSDARLTVAYETGGEEEDLCSPSVLAGYLGAENQAIRVQLVDKDNYAWGFDNASPLYRVTLEDAASDRKTIKLQTEPKDQAHWSLAGQVIEILPWSAVLLNGEKLAQELSPGHFSTLTGGYDPDSGEITLTTALPAGFGEQWKNRDDQADLQTTHFGTEALASEYFFLRAWDRGSDTVSAAVIGIGSNVVLGNTGINISISGDHRMPGDHWIIAARPHTPDQVVPWQLETERPPEGYRRFYAPLASIHWNAPGESEPVIYDCRRKFRPLTDLNGCCTYEVGDGVHSIGDFDSIEQAVRQLPSQGGRICVLPGVHKASLKVFNRENIHITGCGDQSIVHPTEEQPLAPIFTFASCRNIRIDNLTLTSLTGSAVEILDALDADKATVGVVIERNHIFALTHGINIRVQNELAGNNNIRIRDNIIAMWDLEEGDVAIFVGADDVSIDNNEISVVPAPDPQDPDDPRDPDGPDGEIYDPCAERWQFYGQSLWIMQLVISTLFFLTLLRAFKPVEYKARGGIQIGGGSEMVRITRNRISGGYGNGITLGSLPESREQGFQFKGKLYFNRLEVEQQQFLDENFLGSLYEISIENNYIAGMGLSGIGVAAFLHSEEVGLIVSIDEITIRENQITHCANQVPDEKPESMLRESGFGGIVLAACENGVITENKIQDNGRFENQAVCGVLIIYGEDVDISNNRIINNGPLGAVNGQALDRGLRGGIVVLLSFKQLFYQLIQNKGFTRPDGIPAVKVHDNIVVQPMGQALFLVAFGPVSVVGNQFTTQGADYKVNPFSVIASAVIIINLGVSQDLMAAMFLNSFRNVTMGNAKVFTEPSALTQASVASAALRFLYLPSGNVMYTGNQTTLDLQDENIDLAFSAQTIVSLDDIAYNSNQSEVRSLFDLLVTDVALIGATVRANDNRFHEGFTITLNSLMSVGFMNMAATNQATHCIQVLGPPAFTFAPSNSVLYKIGPCAEYGEVIQRYWATEGLVAG
jgi:hypothetical protein